MATTRRKRPRKGESFETFRQRCETSLVYLAQLRGMIATMMDRVLRENAARERGRVVLPVGTRDPAEEAAQRRAFDVALAALQAQVLPPEVVGTKGRKLSAKRRAQLAAQAEEMETFMRGAYEAILADEAAARERPPSTDPDVEVFEATLRDFKEAYERYALSARVQREMELFTREIEGLRDLCGQGVLAVVFGSRPGGAPS